MVVYIVGLLSTLSLQPWDFALNQVNWYPQDLRVLPAGLFIVVGEIKSTRHLIG
jgi:hypothetical protein